MRDVVTGGLGYVGSAVSCAFLEAGSQVLSIDDLSRGSKESPRRLGYANLPLSIQSERTLGAMEDFQPDLVVHCAGSVMVDEGEQKRAEYFVNNVVNHMHFLAHLLRAGVKALIYSSTAAVYRWTETPLTEDSQTTPENWYGWTKLMAECALKNWAKATGATVVIFRFFNVVGSAWGILDNGGTEHVLPRLMKCAATGKAFTLHGNDHPTRDGSPLRDFVSLYDISRAHVAAAKRLRRGDLAGIEVMNLGTGQGTTVLELVRVVERVTGAPITVRIGRRRTGDPPVLVCANRRAKELLDWHPTVGLEPIVQGLWSLMSGLEGSRDLSERTLHR
jgi:UDP-glucose 4-epimerase